MKTTKFIYLKWKKNAECEREREKSESKTVTKYIWTGLWATILCSILFLLEKPIQIKRWKINTEHNENSLNQQNVFK